MSTIQPTTLTISKTTTGTAKCEYRSCKRFLPKSAGPGPRKSFCNQTCRSRERVLRDGKTYVPKGYPTTNPKARKYVAEDSWGSLTLIEYVARTPGGSQGLFRCSCGGEKVLSIGNVVQGLSTNCADRAMHPDPRIKAEIGYEGAHHRVARVKGVAKTLPCLICDEISESNEHAYLHSDPDETSNAQGKEAGKPYSTDPEHYTVLCKSHHYYIDRAHKRTTPKGTTSLFHVSLQAMVSA